MNTYICELCPEFWLNIVEINTPNNITIQRYWDAVKFFGRRYEKDPEIIICNNCVYYAGAANSVFEMADIFHKKILNMEGME